MRVKHSLALAAASALILAGTAVAVKTTVGHAPVWQDEIAFSEPSASETRGPWRFVVMPDLHNAEQYLHRDGILTPPAERARQRDAHTRLYAQIREELGGEIAVLPGDTNAGHWHRPDFASYFRPEASPEARVMAAGEIVYGNLRDAMLDAGFDDIVFAVGDHEIGDDPWYPGTLKDRLVPTFRNSVATEFTDRLRSRYAESGQFFEPTDTPYAGTSYALRYRNAVFVSVDTFEHQEGWWAMRWRQLTDFLSHGSIVETQFQSVAGAVSGRHLGWLDAVLAAANATDGVEHIIVQSHLPVLSPVRGRSSSMMMMEEGADRPCWQVLRRHDVDLYLAGEVHADTLHEDAASGVIQVSSKAGQDRGMVAAVELFQNGIEIAQYGMDGDDLVELGRYRRADGDGSATSSGILVPIPDDASVLHYKFEDTGERLANSGRFGRLYDLSCPRCERVAGIDGTAARFTGATATLIDEHVSPIFQGGAAGSLTLWLRLDESQTERRRRYVVTSGNGIHGRLGYRLFVEDGQLGLTYHARGLAHFESPRDLADGEWHFVSLTQGPEGFIGDLEVSIDGEPASVNFASPKSWLLTSRLAARRPWALSLSIGGASRQNGTQTPPAALDLDEVRYWPQPLDLTEIRDVMNAHAEYLSAVDADQSK